MKNIKVHKKFKSKNIEVLFMDVSLITLLVYEDNLVLWPVS
jgi:hypothetical protein